MPAKPIAKKPTQLEGLHPAAQKLVREAIAALASNALAQADKAITLALAYAPEHPEPKKLLGMFLHRTGRAREALVSLHEANVLRPDDADTLIALSYAQYDAGEFQDAIASMRRAAEKRADANTLFAYGLMLERNAYLDEAVVELRRALELDPKHTLARLQLARDLFYTGHATESEQQFRRLIRDGRELASVWHGLAEMKSSKFDASDLAALKKLRADRRIGGLERATLLHAVGKAYEDNNDFAAAMDAYVEAGKIESARFPCDTVLFDRYIDSIRDAFAETHVHSDVAQGDEVIFIIGMPRTGSTLVEQILAAHSQVEGASEIPDLTLVLDRESQRRGKIFPTWVKEATPQDWQRLGADYLAETSRWRAKKPRFVDKSPGNWMMAEAAMAMLPNARFIDVRRDPLETCWSCFKQFFEPGRMIWASSFDAIAHFWRRCTERCDLLAAREPRRVRIQSFEKLIDDPESQIRELLDFCGLAFEEDCLRFHEAERTIRTASAAQVRRPIARHATSGERYGALLDPLRRALGL